MHAEQHEPLINDRNLAHVMAIASDRNRTTAASIRREQYRWGNRSADEFDHYADNNENAAAKRYIQSLQDQLRAAEGMSQPVNESYFADPDFTHFVTTYESPDADSAYSPEEIRMVIDTLVKKTGVSDEVIGEIVSYLVTSQDPVVSRTAIAEAQDINPAAVSKTVTALVGMQFVTEEKHLTERGGRPLKKLTATDTLHTLAMTYEPWKTELQVRLIAEKGNMTNKECKSFIVKAGSAALLGAMLTPRGDETNQA